jgi:hypothetical protein
MKISTVPLADNFRDRAVRWTEFDVVLVQLDRSTMVAFGGIAGKIIVCGPFWERAGQ